MAIVHFVNYKRGTQSRAAMRGVMLYVMQEKKTAWEDGQLVSGINCQVQSVYDDFLNTKLLYHKDGGVMFYHMVQSFPKGAAVDPRQAHEAARRLAEYFDGCEVLACTHVDREHIHSHCVINSVNFETGKKLHMAKEQIQELMRRNDAICQEMGLPVFDAPTQQSRGMGGAEYHTALRGQSWKFRLMNTIDACMKYAADRDAFVSLMASEGYAVRWEGTRKYITYTTSDGMRCRDNKLHEEKYCKEAMEHEFRIRAEIVQRKFHRAEETDGGIEAAESAAQRIDKYTAADDATHRDPVRSAADDKQTAGTGWEPEREVFLQMDSVAAGLQPAGSPQVDHAAFGNRRSGDGWVVWRGSDPRPVPLIPAVAGLSAVGTLLDEDEDAEEKRRRMEAKIAAENLGAVIGFAAGAAKLRPMALENMLAELRKRKHHGKRINESTAQRYLSVVSAVLSDAKRNEIIEKNPARMLDLPTPQRTVQRIPTRGEAEKLLDALAKEPRHYRLFYLLSMYTGCRRGELCALQWSDFTGTQNGLLLTVSRSRSSVPGKGIVEGSTKNGKSREVYLSSDLRGILLAYKRRKQMEADKQRRRLSPYLFTDEHGQLIHPDTFTKRLRKIYASIGFPQEYHLHTLRHYFVTSLLHCGVDKQTVADLVGHADTGFLERTYCHPQQAQKEQAADSMRTMLRPDGEQIFNLAAACSPKQHSA